MKFIELRDREWMQRTGPVQHYLPAFYYWKKWKNFEWLKQEFVVSILAVHRKGNRFKWSVLITASIKDWKMMCITLAWIKVWVKIKKSTYNWFPIGLYPQDWMFGREHFLLGKWALCQYLRWWPLMIIGLWFCFHQQIFVPGHCANVFGRPATKWSLPAVLNRLIRTLFESVFPLKSLASGCPISLQIMAEL